MEIIENDSDAMKKNGYQGHISPAMRDDPGNGSQYHNAEYSPDKRLDPSSCMRLKAHFFLFNQIHIIRIVFIDI